MRRPFMLSLTYCCAISMGAATSTAHAADNDITTTFSGYGTVEATRTSNAKAEYIENLQEFKGATDQVDIGGGSRLGLQGTVNFGTRFSLTAQVLASRAGLKDFDIGTEWMFGQYEPLPGVDFRVGRVVNPTFLFSDTRNVGYAATWLRAPNEIYAQNPFRTLDGAQAIWRTDIGPVALTSQFSYGKTSASVLSAVGVLEIPADKTMNLGFSAEMGSWTARVSQTRLEAALPAPFNFVDKDKFFSLGLQYDDGKAVFLSEWARRTQNVDPAYGVPLYGSKSWYVATGWHFDKFTPMVRYSSFVWDKRTLAYVPTKPSVGAIFRYDVYRNVALKAQIDRYDATNQAFVKPLAATGTKVTVMSVGADFVF